MLQWQMPRLLVPRRRKRNGALSRVPHEVITHRFQCGEGGWLRGGGGRHEHNWVLPGKELRDKMTLKRWCEEQGIPDGATAEDELVSSLLLVSDRKVRHFHVRASISVFLSSLLFVFSSLHDAFITKGEKKRKKSRR
jgi:hypothetical protein